MIKLLNTNTNLLLVLIGCYLFILLFLKSLHGNFEVINFLFSFHFLIDNACAPVLFFKCRQNVIFVARFVVCNGFDTSYLKHFALYKNERSIKCCSWRHDWFYIYFSTHCIKPVKWLVHFCEINC